MNAKQRAAQNEAEAAWQAAFYNPVIDGETYWTELETAADVPAKDDTQLSLDFAEPQKVKKVIH